jgi:hypothetical protein
MKGETFGFSGDCHDLGLACSSGLPFRHSHESGNPGPCLSRVWIPASNREDDKITNHCGYDERRMDTPADHRGYDVKQMDARQNLPG